MTDSQLLERFLQHNHVGAFEDLVRSHGPMVWKVCQRILMNHHDAEEAFQATFLVLARKARSLLRRRSVAGWLYEVAYRTALGARRDRAVRRKREQQMEPLPDRIAESAEGMTDIARVLDQELSRLPEKYRLAVVLCDLEGQRLQDVAAQLGCPLGTLSGWLTRAREMLRQRLVRQGVAVSSGVLAMALSQQAASAGVPAALVSSTVQVVNVFTISSAVTTGAMSPQVATLTEGVLKMMFYAQLKQMTLVAAIVWFAGLGAGGLVYQMQAAEADARTKEVLEKLQGKWNVVKFCTDGEEKIVADVKGMKFSYTFNDQKIAMNVVADNIESVVTGSLTIDATKLPFEMDVTDQFSTRSDLPEGRKFPHQAVGIFEFDGDTLKMRMITSKDGNDEDGNPLKRPTDFKTTTVGPKGDVIVTLERDKS